MTSVSDSYLRTALKGVVRNLLELGTFRFTVLFLTAAVLVSVSIVLVIDLTWDGVLSAELEFAGVVTPFLDAMVLVIFVNAMFDEIRAEMALRKQAEAEVRRLNEALEARVEERNRQLLLAQEELVRKEKLSLLGQVADNVGHELRNPLGVMNNAVYYLQAVLSDADETTKEYLGIIKDEIADAERIVSDLLDAVRSKPPHPEAVDVAQQVGQTLRKCNVPSTVTVSLGIPVGLTVHADRMHLHQVLWNLITNAVEAMPQGGTLAVHAHADEAGKTVTLSVQDSGAGIAPEQQGKLFQPMYTTKARRVGLGLVVVKNLAQLNGGRVAMESFPGKGSSFMVTLPCGN